MKKKHKKKKKMDDDNQVTSQKSNNHTKSKNLKHMSPDPLRNSLKKKKSKHKLSGILNISSA